MRADADGNERQIGEADDRQELPRIRDQHHHGEHAEAKHRQHHVAPDAAHVLAREGGHPADHEQRHADHIGPDEESPAMALIDDAEEAEIEGQQRQARTCRRRSAREEAVGPGRLVGIIERHVEAGKPQGAADGQHEADHPAQGAQRIERPDVQQDCGCNAEIDEVGERIKLGAEARRAFQEACEPAVHRIEDDRQHDAGHRQFIALLEGEANGGDAAAQGEQRDHVGKQVAHRHHAETALAPVGGHGAVHAARFALHQLVRPWRSGSIESRSASTVSPAMARWPRQASDLAPFGR